jgi:hypothetical protein
VISIVIRRSAPSGGLICLEEYGDYDRNGQRFNPTPAPSNPIDMEIEEIAVFLNPVFQAFVDGIAGFEG